MIDDAGKDIKATLTIDYNGGISFYSVYHHITGDTSDFSSHKHSWYTPEFNPSKNIATIETLSGASFKVTATRLPQDITGAFDYGINEIGQDLYYGPHDTKYQFIGFSNKKISPDVSTSELQREKIYLPNDEIEVFENTTLYAVWIKINQPFGIVSGSSQSQKELNIYGAGTFSLEKDVINRKEYETPMRLPDASGMAEYTEKNCLVVDFMNINSVRINDITDVRYFYVGSDFYSNELNISIASEDSILQTGTFLMYNNKALERWTIKDGKVILREIIRGWNTSVLERVERDIDEKVDYDYCVTIRDEAFADIEGDILMIPFPVTEIAPSAFVNSCFKELFYNAEKLATEYETSPFAQSYIESVVIGPDVEIIPKGLFANTTSILDFDGVISPRFANESKDAGAECCLKTIEDKAFYNSGIEELYTPASVENIGSEAFAKCSNLKLAEVASSDLKDLSPASDLFAESGENGYIDLIRFTDRVTRIPANFISCSEADKAISVNYITIPESLKAIGDNAFCGLNTGGRETHIVYDATGEASPDAETIIKKYASIDFEGDWNSFSNPLMHNVKNPGSVVLLDGSGKTVNSCFPVKLTTKSGIEDLEYYPAGLDLKALAESLITELKKSEEFNGAAVCFPSDKIDYPQAYMISLEDKDVCATFYTPEGLVSLTWDELKIPENGEHFNYNASAISNTEVGEEAFIDCETIIKISLPESITSIGPRAFYNSRIEKFDVTSALSNIGDYVFCNCDNLEAINLSGNISTIGEHAFFDCENLSSVTLSNGLKEIGNYAFFYCPALDKINFEGIADEWNTINKGIYILGDNTEIQYLESGAIFFYENEYVKLSWNELKLSKNGQKYNYDASKVKDANIGSLAFAHCQALKTIILPDTVKNIDSSAFSHCSNLTGIILGSGIETVGQLAFYNCTALSNIQIPDSVTSIEGASFRDVNNLSYSENMRATGSPWGAKCVNGHIDGSFVFADSSKQILCGCLSTVTGKVSIPDTVTDIGESAFSMCKNLEEVIIPDSVTSIRLLAFYDCTAMTKVIIPGTVEVIGDSAFSCCGSLSSLTLSNGIKAINTSAFRLCESLKSVNIPSSVESIEKNAFSYCYGLEKISVAEDNPAYSNDIYGVLFNKDKTNLVLYPSNNKETEYSIPNGVKCVSESAFSYCENLTKLFIPASVENIIISSIDDIAFYYCRRLETIIVNENNPFYSSDEFGVLFNKDKTELIQYPAGNKNDSYRIPDTVKTVKENAFSFCQTSKLIFGSNIKTFENSSFMGAKEIEYIGTENDFAKIETSPYTFSGIRITYTEEA